ncbi:DASH complex subunit Spc34 [Phyllosticta capitalensis]|uniref:DASH complex subunit SPC34 n=1 Tax=Phyllosticta capitalensis TaxID=121624 RepID=A0ABR1YG01_9PEZI
MSLLETHLEQISLCSASIAELPFPPPKIFTNALLHPHDITALIRDTESHERALFSVPPPPPAPKAQESASSRRKTVFEPNNAGSGSTMGGGANAVRAPRRNTAVAAILGSELVERIREGGGGGAGSGLGYRAYGGRERGDIDVETLLEGAEKLCGVYHIPGVNEKIAQLRQRHARLQSNIDHYEMRVAEQQVQLARQNRHRGDYENDSPPASEPEPEPEEPAEAPLTIEDLQREEEEIRELEKKKRGLEDRVNSMGRDLRGVRHALK